MQLTIRQRIANWIAGENRYDGATYSPTRSFIPTTSQGARFDASYSARIAMLGKARDAERNNSLVNRMADLWECYTVGTGLRMQPSSSDGAWNAAAAVWLDGWEPFADISSRQGWGTLQSLVARIWFIDGEAFILKVRGQGGRPRLQVVEGHLVATPPKLAERKDIVDGIQVDGNGRPIAYYIGTEVEAGKIVFGNPLAADEVIHVFEPSRPGQLRGITMLHPVLNDLADLGDLQTLEMQSCKSAAAIALTNTTATGEVSAADYRRAAFTKSNQSSSGANVTESSVQLVGDVIGARVVGLKTGEQLSQFMANRPAQAVRDFWRLLETKICLGCGFPYVLVNPDSMQGTVYRGSLDMATAFFRARSQVMANFASEVYRYVMGFAKNDPALGATPPDWAKCTTVPPRAPNVDVGRNSAAMLAELAAGISNYDIICAADGRDWRNVLRKKAEQAKFIRDLATEFSVDASEISTSQADKVERVSTESTSKDAAPPVEELP